MKDNLSGLIILLPEIAVGVLRLIDPVAFTPAIIIVTLILSGRNDRV